MASNFQPAPSDMVQQVRSIIEGYGDNGSLRALAQEPVQNSLDAKHNSRFVSVEYRLLERRDAGGQPYHLLTVTDSGTHGLRGPALTQQELQERGYELKSDENWAAFEGQGFTRKANETSGGTRGQGKAAFLFHSTPPATRGRRMMMLYDSLLVDGLYRLGVRNANPADTILTPPTDNAAAREIIRGHFTDNTGLDIDLSLEPLTKVGTRVIVPYLSEEAVAAIKNGELVHWLQRCWWRAIQTGDLEITVVDTIGHSEKVSVPEWWRDEPWTDTPAMGVEVGTWENIELGDGLRLKRIVLLYDESLELSDTEGEDAQFDGVQLLRGKQWITTMGSRQHFSTDDIPRERRPGFRGFVEFDQALERELRDRETPQHHKFNRRDGLVQAVYREVERIVGEFAEEMGWHEGRPAPRPSQQPDIARELLQWFAPNARGPAPTPPREQWECQLSFSLPDPAVARVMWGETLKAIQVRAISPTPHPKDTTVTLDAQHVEEALRVELWREETITYYDREGTVNRGDFQVVEHGSRPDQFGLPTKGKWRITARIRQAGRIVASVSRSIYVHQDPPEPDPHPLTLSLSIVNRNHPEQRRLGRINYGDTVSVQITARNTMPREVPASLDASVSGFDQLLVDGKRVELVGTPQGDSVYRQAVWMEEIQFVDPEDRLLPDGNKLSIPIERGRQSFRADLHATIDGEELIAHASQVLYVDTDPSNGDWLPFRLQPLPDSNLPRWQLAMVDNVLELQFPENYATHKELSKIDSDTSTGGRNAFLLEIICEALLQWALEPAWSEGVRANLEELLNGTPQGVAPDTWVDFQEMMEKLELAGKSNSEMTFKEIAEGYRKCAAHMMRMYEESH